MTHDQIICALAEQKKMVCNTKGLQFCHRRTHPFRERGTGCGRESKWPDMSGHHENEGNGDLLSLAGKAVADAVLVLDVRGCFGIRLDLAAQMGNVDTWIMMLGLILEAPYLFKQLLE